MFKSINSWEKIDSSAFIYLCRQPIAYICVYLLWNYRLSAQAAATKEEITQQMPAARLIHGATHGLLDDFQGSGVAEAILLAHSKGDKGLLCAGEILQMKLNADLVVLSACGTRRKRITGDGVIGLSRALMGTDVPARYVSLWALGSAPTAITEFTGIYNTPIPKTRLLLL